MSSTEIQVFNPANKSIQRYKVQPLVEYGFKAFNRIPWHDRTVDSYNNYTTEINSATYKPERELLLDRRHQFFVLMSSGNQVTGPLTAEIEGKKTSIVGCSHPRCRRHCIRRIETLKVELRERHCASNDTRECNHYIVHGVG